MHAYLFKQMFTNHRVGHHEALCKPDAGQSAKLRIAAFDELGEARGV